MADLTNEEKNEKIRNKWLERIEQNEKLFAKQFKKENLPFEQFLEIEKLQKKNQEFKKLIVDGHTPDELPVIEGGGIDGKLFSITEQINMDDFERICVEPLDLSYEAHSQYNPGIEGKKEGGNKFIGRICEFFLRKK